MAASLAVTSQSPPPTAVVVVVAAAAYMTIWTTRLLQEVPEEAYSTISLYLSGLPLRLLFSLQLQFESVGRSVHTRGRPEGGVARGTHHATVPYEPLPITCETSYLASPGASPPKNFEPAMRCIFDLAYPQRQRHS